MLNTNEQTFDLAIVGGGIMGASHALFALERGLRVGLFEKNHEPQGATVRNFGQVVPSGFGAKWQQIGRRSLEIYKGLQARFDLSVRQNGTVYLSSNFEEMTLLEELAAINEANDYPSHLLTAEECLGRYDGLRRDYVWGGLFFPGEITLEPRMAVSRLLGFLVEQRGLQFFPNALVADVQPSGEGCRVATSAGRAFRAAQVLVCTGSDFKNLFPDLFYASDIDVCKLQMLETQPQTGQKLPGSILTGLGIRRYESFHECPSWAAIKAAEAADSPEKRWGVHILFKQTLDGSVILGDSHEYAPAREADRLGFDLQADINQFMLEKAREIFDLHTWEIRRTWPGFYCQCRERDLFEHTIEGRIHIVTGIGGKGMTASPGFAQQNIARLFGEKTAISSPKKPEKPIQMVVFDMAGTVVDEDNAVYKTVHRAIAAAGFEVDYPTVLFHAAGKEKLQAIRDVLAHLAGQPAPEDVAQAVFADFKIMLDEVYRAGDFRAQPGAESVFQKLQAEGVKVVLNTGYSRAVADLLLEKLGWLGSPLIDLVLTADDVQRGRPHPDMIQLAMRKLGIRDAASVAKIGDSAIDIEEGRNAGCGLTFGITTGAHTAVQLAAAAPTAVLGHLEEMLAFVLAR